MRKLQQRRERWNEPRSLRTLEQFWKHESMHSLDPAVHAEVAAFIWHKYSKSYGSKTKVRQKEIQPGKNDKKGKCCCFKSLNLRPVINGKSGDQLNQWDYSFINVFSWLKVCDCSKWNTSKHLSAGPTEVKARMAEDILLLQSLEKVVAASLSIICRKKASKAPSLLHSSSWCLCARVIKHCWCGGRTDAGRRLAENQLAKLINARSRSRVKKDL